LVDDDIDDMDKTDEDEDEDEVKLFNVIVLKQHEILI
jgi:hypothetical protein